MPRSIWTGSLSFGLVNIPVKLYNAVSQKDIRFHQLHDADGVRIQQKRICPVDGQEVSIDHVVKGFEIGPDQYVRIDPEELESLDPKATHGIDIEDFVGLEQIDPIYYEHNYYVAPARGAENAYLLLLTAMERARRIAIARVVLRTKQYLCAIRPRGNALVMSTMLFADEVVPEQAVSELPRERKAPVNERQLAMAQQLIDSLSADFDPEKYHDEYRARVLALIERKAEGEPIVAQPPRKEPAKVINLMEALEASLAASKKKAAPAKAPARGAKPNEKSKRKKKA